MSFVEHTGNGEGENFYLHVLRHYIPKHMPVTYQRHKLEVEIFSMEDFQYKNYTPKHVIQSRNNGCGVQAKNSLNILQLLYSHAEFNVDKELKKRNKDTD